VRARRALGDIYLILGIVIAREKELALKRGRWRLGAKSATLARVMA
jgi:hypothetical protein